MKKSLAILSIALASMVCANTTPDLTISVPKKHKQPDPNQLSFGPVVFWQYFNEEKTAAVTKSNGVFGGAELRYEYIKPDAFYAGTDGMFALGRVRDQLKIEPKVDLIKRNALAANLEQRFGYTAAMNGYRSTFTPFIGLGWYYTKPVVDNKFSNDFVYATAGFKSHCEVTNNFALGIVGKALYSFYDRTHVAGITNSTWDDTAWGFEVDVPMTWHLDDAKVWDLSFEPYFQDLDVTNHFMNVGGRLLASYQF